MTHGTDQVLRAVLQRVEAPASLRSRVLEALPAPRARSRWWITSGWAATLAVMLLLGQGWLRSTQQQQADRYRRQTFYALQLTSTKLAVIRTRLQRSSPELNLPEFNLKERTQ